MHTTPSKPLTKRRRSWKRRLVRFAIVALVGWLLCGGMVSYVLTHRVRPVFAEPAPAVEGKAVESHRPVTADGERIGAWFVRPTGSQNVTVVLLHGNNRSRRAMYPLLRTLAESGYGALAITFRAHGDSTGRTNDIGYSMRHDVVAAVEFLEREHPGGRIVLCGTSLGSAAAVFAAKDLGPRVHGYVLDSPYLDLKTAVRNRTSMYLPPVLDDVAYGALRVWAPLFLPVSVDEISPVKRLADIPSEIPVLILAGSRDRHSPLEQCRAMSEAIASHSRLIVFKGARHSRLFKHDKGRYRDVLVEFLQRIAADSELG